MGNKHTLPARYSSLGGSRTVGVTGAAGFIGSHLCEKLLEIGVEVVGLDDLSHGSLENLAQCQHNPSFRFSRGDCTRPDIVLDSFSRCSVIVHLAGRKIPRYGAAPQYLRANVAGFNAVCDAALTLGAELCIASTSDVYGNAPPPLVESDSLILGPPTTWRWSYAVSKLYGEHLALGLGEECGLRVRVLRLFGCYGPRNHRSWWGGPQAAFIEALLSGKRMEIHGDGRQIRTLTYISDTVDGIVKALATPAAIGEVINIGGGTPVTILALAELIQGTVGIAPPLRARFIPYDDLPGRYQDVQVRIPDTGKARELLGFEARTGLSDGIESTVNWHRRVRLAGGASAKNERPRLQIAT